MEEGERHVHEFFHDDTNVERLVAFLTVEEKKGKDKFNGVRFSLFRVSVTKTWSASSPSSPSSVRHPSGKVYFF